MTLTISGRRKLFSRLKAVNDVMQKNFWIGVQEDLEANLLANIKPHTKEGRLERNAYSKLIDNGVEAGIKDNGMLVSWNGARINYGVFVHEGTRPHEIRPKKKKALSDGVNMFGRLVNHPGYKGDPFLDDAAKKTYKSLARIFKEELRKKGLT